MPRGPRSSFLQIWARLIKWLLTYIFKLLGKAPEDSLDQLQKQDTDIVEKRGNLDPEEEKYFEIPSTVTENVLPKEESATSNSRIKEFSFQDPDSHIVTECEKQYFQLVDSDDGIGLYFNEAWRIPLLTAEEEIGLAKRMKSGLAARERLQNLGDTLSPEDVLALQKRIQDGEDAKEQFILANLRLVIHNARKYKNRGLSFLDLIQEGNIGLMRATEKFDHSLGNRFSTYATWWIRQAISRAVADQGRTLRLPIHLQEQFSKHQSLLSKYLIEQNMSISLEEFAAICDIDLKKFTPLLRITMPPLDIDKTLDEEDGIHLWEALLAVDSEEVFQQDDFTFLADMLDPFGNYIPRLLQIRKQLIESAGLLSSCEMGLGDLIINEEVDVEKDTETQLMKRDLHSALSNLPKREACILRMRFGLNEDIQVFTLKELGERLKVTRERVRQIEIQALTRLRNSSAATDLRAYLNA